MSDERLALYSSPTCGYCFRVLRVIERLGIPVEIRNVREPAHARSLLAARGRRTVPVLRITSDRADRWMPESRDIVAYLEARFGASAA